jgi:hypothetical protein
MNLMRWRSLNFRYRGGGDMPEQPNKVSSFAGAEFIAKDEFRCWRAVVLEEFFRQCPEAYGELTGRIEREIEAVRITALRAAQDESFREEILQRYGVRKRGTALAMFICFPRIREGKTEHRITTAHLRLCNNDYLPDLQPFRDAFLSWLRRYSLAVNWVADALLDWLRCFERHPEIFREGFQGNRGRAGWVVESPSFQFEFRGFELTGEHLADYRAALEQSFQRALAGHLAGIEAQAKRHRLRRARMVDPIHARWLVGRLCRRLSYRDIIGGENITEDAVKKAVARLAAALGLVLPDLRNGRTKDNGDISGQR